MPLELVTIPCLSDNYAYLIHDPETGATAVVDVPDAAPILAALGERGWALTDIWLTHHHSDHIQGVADLRAATGARVTGAAAPSALSGISTSSPPKPPYCQLPNTIRMAGSE